MLVFPLTDTPDDGLTPSDAQTIIALADTDDAAPIKIITALRHALAAPHAEIDPATSVTLTDWIAFQREQQSRATIVLDLLDRNHPIPTRDELVAGTAAFPAWMTQWWAVTLRMSWSGRLERAVNEAVAYLAAGGVTGIVEEM
jgi:hypothetical protein